MPTNSVNLQSVNTPFQLSENGTDWKVLVCTKTKTAPFTLPTTENETDCGPKIGVGNVKFNPSGTGTYEIEPDADEVSHDDLIQWMNNKQLIYWKWENLTAGSIGRNFYYKGQCYVTAVTPSTQAGDLINFDFTLSGTGTLTTIAP